MIVTINNINVINKFINNLIEKSNLDFFFIFTFLDTFLLKEVFFLDENNNSNLKNYTITSQSKKNNLNFSSEYLKQLFKETKYTNKFESQKKINNENFFNSNLNFNYNYTTINEIYPYRLRENFNLNYLVPEKINNFFKFKFEEDDNNKGKLPRNKQNYRTGVFLCIWLTVITVLGLYFYFYFLLIKYSYLFFLFIIFIFYFFYKFFIFKKKKQKIFYLVEL